MQSLRKLKPGHGLVLQDIPLPPAPAPGEVLIKVQSAGVCGTDLHIDEWTASYHFLAPALPVTVGHEFSGVIAALGDGVTGLAPGQLVAVRPSVVCGHCEACRAHQPDACLTRRGIGVLRDGGFSPYTLVPARNCVRIPCGVDAEVAAMTEPLTVSHEAVRTGGVKPGGMELVKQQLGFNALHVPFSGGPPIMNAMMGGQIQLSLLPAVTVLPMVQAGKLKAIAVSSAQRSPLAPDLASMEEIGAKGVDIEVWNAIMAPARMPAAHQARLNTELAKILNGREMRQKLFAQGWKVGDTSAASLTQRIKSDTAIYGALIAQKGIKLD